MKKAGLTANGITLVTALQRAALPLEETPNPLEKAEIRTLFANENKKNTLSF